MLLSTTDSKESTPNRIYLLGPMRVEQQEEVVTLPGGKAASLFALLCLEAPHVQTRARLIERLWPAREPTAARRALTEALYRLRRSAVGSWLEANQEQIGLRESTARWIDAHAFEQAAATLQSAEHALHLYRGDLLEGFFDDWVLAPRYALRDRFLDLLFQTAEHASAAGDDTRARAYFQRHITEEPLDERAYRGLMQALDRMGRTTDALQLYDQLVEVLRKEMDVAPGEESQKLAADLRAARHVLHATTAAQMPTARTDAIRLPFGGRRHERRLLLHAVEATIDGNGKVIAVEGPAGIGKSRLLEEVGQSASWRGAQVGQGVASERPSLSPFSALAQATASLLNGLYADQVAALLPDATLAAFAPLYPTWHSRAELPNLPPVAARQRLHAAVSAVFEALCTLTPCVLMLDDMHWATRDQWGLLETLAATCERHPLLILVGYRRTPLESSSGWDVLQRWERQGWLTPCPLEPLTPAEVAAMLPARYRDQAEEIHSVSGGTPYFLLETLLGLESEQRPYRLTVEQRLARLRPAERAALEAAAVAGNGAPYALWQAVADQPAPAMAQHSRRLAAAALLDVDDRGWRFPHALIATAAYELVEPPHRAALHERAATALAEDDEAIPLRAFHLAAAGKHQEAAALYRTVAATALATYAYSDAQRALSKALELAPPNAPDDHAALLLELSRTCGVTGDRTAQQAALEQAERLQTALSPSVRLELLIERAHFAFFLGDQTAANQLLDEAEGLATATQNETLLTAVYLHRGDVAMHFGHNRSALDALEQALALAQAQEDRTSEGRALDGLAWAYANLNEPVERILPLYEQAISAQIRAGNEFEEARARINYLSALQDIGAWDQAAALADRTLAAQQRTGYVRGEGAVRQARGLIALALGDHEQAFAETEAARAIFGDIDERLGYIIATTTLANVRYRLGETEAAETLLEEAIQEARTLDSLLFEAFALQDLGIQLFEQGRIADAVPLLQKAVDNWEATGERLNRYQCETYLAWAYLTEGQEEQAHKLVVSVWQAFEKDKVAGETPQNWFWALAQLMCELERTEAHARALHAAYAELQTQAKAISDHAVRRRFFTAVPINHAIVTAHDRLTETERDVTVFLAHEAAPLGRKLGDDERVAITWTLLGPEDEAIVDKSEQRRHRLKRLVAQAGAQHGAPTDQDLADALGVSRRTILRDLAILEAQGTPLPTRGRRT